MTIITRVILVLALMYAPILSFWYFSGLSGDNPVPHVIMLVGHALVIVSAWLAQKRRKFYILIAIGAAMFFFGQRLDKAFWKEHNSNLCLQLRADPLCVESPTGFRCKEPSPLGNLTVGKGICDSVGNTH